MKLLQDINPVGAGSWRRIAATLPCLTSFDHMFTICWLADLVIGMVLATLVFGWRYKD